MFPQTKNERKRSLRETQFLLRRILGGTFFGGQKKYHAVGLTTPGHATNPAGWQENKGEEQQKESPPYRGGKKEN